MISPPAEKGGSYTLCSARYFTTMRGCTRACFTHKQKGEVAHTFPMSAGRPRNTEAHCDLPPARTRPHTASHSVFRGLTSVHNASGAELAAWRSTPHAARSVFASGSDRPPHAVVTALAVRKRMQCVRCAASRGSRVGLDRVLDCDENCSTNGERHEGISSRKAMRWQRQRGWV
jgi:hypothetical protein